jgi:hypothetical protein
MARIKYQDKKLSADKLAVIRQANVICADYQAQGYDLTLRQLYYQFVARDLIPNRQSEYKRLGAIINDARLGGLLDWDYIVDRTRNVRSMATWGDPSDIISASARILVLVMFVKLHLGDHDPSGIDMTRDIRDRLQMFLDKDLSLLAVEEHREWLEAAFERTDTTTAKEMKEKDPATYREFTDMVNATYGSYGSLTVDRIALNMDQIEQYDPPPNPAKITDSRATSYIAIYGTDSWELDALEPTVLGALIQDSIDEAKDPDRWDEDEEAERRHREHLSRVSARWTEVIEQFAS